jgi:tRNA nucleotidyltransferase (CCA-adding enzyme)
MLPVRILHDALSVSVFSLVFQSSISVGFLIFAAGATSCTMRVCGGWVRDKLLQRENDDIDICLDTCSGVEFTTQLKAWHDSTGISSLCSSIGVIKASSEKSKHLETATLRITVTGENVPPNSVVSLDFVQLRSESYADDSRVPDIQAATAEQDALRRDFTINAMFVVTCCSDFQMYVRLTYQF